MKLQIYQCLTIIIMIQLGLLSLLRGVVADKFQFHNANAAKSHGHFKRFDIDNGDGEGSTAGDAIIELYDNGPSIRCRMKRGRGKRGNPRFCQTDFTSVTMVDAKCQTNNKYHDYNVEGGGRDRGGKRQRKHCFVASIVDGNAGKIYHINSNGEVSERDTQDYPDEEEPVNEEEIAPPEEWSVSQSSTQFIGRSSSLIRDSGVDEGNNTSLDVIINSASSENNTFTVGNDAVGNDTIDINFTFDDEYALHEHALQDKFDSYSGNIPVIDVLVVYTQGAKADAQYHSDGPVEDLVNLAMAETNLAYYNSGIHAQLNLIKLHEDTTGYSEDVKANSMASLLYHLTFHKGSSNHDPEGYLDYVHEMREDVGADMVALITTGPGCGIAWVSGNAVDALPSRSRMFSVTKYSCATGYYSFAHELAHNMGALHDKGTADACGSTDYRYGYRDPNGRYRSILSYSCRTGQCDNNAGGPCTRSPFFSNPDRQWNGLPMGNTAEGIGETNNARTISERAEHISNFYTRPAPFHLPTLQPTPRPSKRAKRRKRTFSPNISTTADSENVFSPAPTRMSENAGKDRITNDLDDTFARKRVRKHSAVEEP